MSTYVGDDYKSLIVANWFRKSVASEISIDDICKIIIAFAKIYDRFAGYDETTVQVTHDGTVATNITFGNRSIYCKLIIPNQTNETFKWKFKCCQMGDPLYYGIGIDAIKNETAYNDYFYNIRANINYIYKANGDMWECGERITDSPAVNRTAGWTKDDMITLIYNGRDRRLSVSINNEHDEDSILKVEESKGGFRVVVFMDETGEQIELLR